MMLAMKEQMGAMPPQRQEPPAQPEGRPTPAAEARKSPEQMLQIYQADIKQFVTSVGETFKFVGEGGEHIVYALDEEPHPLAETILHADGTTETTDGRPPQLENEAVSERGPGIVYKLNKMETQLALKTMLALDRLPDENDLKTVKKNAGIYWSMEQENRAELLEELRGELGKEAVPPQKFLIETIQTTPELLQKIAGDNPELLQKLEAFKQKHGKLPDQIPAWILIQKRMDTPKEKLTLTNRYLTGELVGAAQDPEKQLAMQKADALIWNGDDIERTDAERREAVAPVCRDLVPLIRKLDALEAGGKTDPKVHAEYLQMKEEIGKAAKTVIAFVEKHRLMVDLVGAGNMQIVKSQNDRWELRLPDIIPPEEMRLTNFSEQMQDLHRTGEAQGNNEMLNGIPMMRTLNAMATIAGIQERLRIPVAEGSTETLKINPARLHDFDRNAFGFLVPPSSEPAEVDREARTEKPQKKIPQAA